MDIYKECFDNLTDDEEWCASMCESIICYGGRLGGYEDEQYLTSHRNKLGDKTVEWIFYTLQDYIDRNYYIAQNCATDSEGLSYNSFIKKEVL